MGFNIFRDDWSRMESGELYLSDCTRLDPKLDRQLIEYIALHGQGWWMPKFLRRYKITEEFLENADHDDPGGIWRTYQMMREQTLRESSRETLKKAAFHGSISDIRKFAFCRLTGYRWDKSAYTYGCGLKSDMLRRDIEAFCGEMIEKEGPFACEAREWLARLPEIPDERLDEWTEGDTERTIYSNLHEQAHMLLNPLGDDVDPDSTWFQKQVRSIFDAYIMMVYEERFGKVTREKKRRLMDSFTGDIYKILKKMARKMIHNETDAVIAVLSAAGEMRHDITRDMIHEIVWDDSSGRDPQHGYFLGTAYQYGIETEQDEKKASRMYIMYKFDR